MASASPVPWYNRPAREFPAQVWLRQRYGFTVPPLRFAPHYQQGRRPFPALVWLYEQYLPTA